MSILNDWDIKNRKTQAVEKAIGLHDGLDKIVINTFWEHRDKIAELDGVYKKIPLVKSNRGSLLVYLKSNGNDLHVEVDISFGSMVQDILKTDVKKGLFGPKRTSYHRGFGLTQISPEVLATALQQVVERDSIDIINEKMVDANLKSLPTLRFSKELSKGCQIKSYNDCDNNDYSIFVLRGKLYTSSVKFMVDNIDKDLWLSDYRNNIITFNSQTDALNALNIMADTEYIYPEEVDVQFPDDGMNVTLTEIDGDTRQPIIEIESEGLTITSVKSHDIIRRYKPDDLTSTFEKVMFEQVYKGLDLSDLNETELQK